MSSVMLERLDNWLEKNRERNTARAITFGGFCGRWFVWLVAAIIVYYLHFG